MRNKTPRYNVLLIDGGSRQVLPMIKGFHQLGCKVTVYCSSRWDIGYVCRYTDHRFLGVFDLHDEEKTTQSIYSVIISGKFQLVVPMNDFAANILSRNKKMFSRYAYIYVNDYDTFSLASDKLNTMKICMDNHIPCPRTALFKNINDFDDHDWSYPLVIKPRSGYGAKGFHIISDHKEMIRLFQETEKKFGASLLQEYIPQTAQQYQVEMVMDKKHQCRSIIVMDKVRWFPLNGGSSTLNRTIKDKEIEQCCIILLQKLNWVGYASLDLIRDPRDKKAKILEINPRINGTVKICFQSGIDIAKQILQEAQDLEVTLYKPNKLGIYLRYFHMDFLWFLKSSARFRTNPSWFSFHETIDEIFSWKDPMPGIVYSIVSIKKLFQDKKNRTV